MHEKHKSVNPTRSDGILSENGRWILLALLVWWTVNVLPLVRKADESGPRTV